MNAFVVIEYCRLSAARFLNATQSHVSEIYPDSDSQEKVERRLRGNESSWAGRSDAIRSPGPTLEQAA